MRLRRIVDGRPDALAVAGKDDADAEVLDEQEQDQVIERVLQDVLYKSQWNAVGMCLLNGLLLLLLLLLLLSSHTITKTTLPQLWLSPPYSSLRTLVSLSIFTAHDSLSLITHFRPYRSTRDSLRSPAYRGAQAPSSSSTDDRDTRLRLTKPTTGILDWLSSFPSSSSFSPAQAVHSRKEETRLDTLNTTRAKVIRKIFFIWLKINICTLVVAGLLAWLSSPPRVAEEEKLSIGIVGKATNVLEIIVSLGWLTLLELDESVPTELEGLRKKRYDLKGA